MRKIKASLLILLILGSLMGQAQNMEFVVRMKARCDRTQLCQRASFCATKAERRDYVVRELKAFAEATQSDLRLTLSELEQQGLVSEVTSLWSANALCFTATEEVAQSLRQRPDVESIDPVRQYQCIPEVEAPVGATVSRSIAPNITQVNADQVWEQGYRGQGVVVAVIDSGVNYNHADLADHLWDGGEEFPHHGFDVYNNDDDPMDDKGHGTHCAGIVCGDGTVGLVTGAAPDATLMCVKCINAEGYGGAANFVKGMEWAVEHGCDLISMSLGIANAEIADKELLRHTCESLLDAGILVVVCAGNEGTEFFMQLCPIPNNVRVPGSCPPPYLDPDQMENPGGLSCVMTVGSVDENDTASSFSSQGPVTWQDTEFGDYPYNPGMGLIRPDVCAPGEVIWSLHYINIYDYDYMTGTSQATPCVAGIVALMLCKNPQLTPAQIYQIIEETSLKLTPEKSNITGVGRVDALAAVNAVEGWDGVDEAAHDGPIDAQQFTSLQVIDMTGRIVLTRRYPSGDFIGGELPPGVYVMRWINGQEVRTQKVVIPHNR